MSMLTSSPGRLVSILRTTRPVGRSIHASRLRPARTSTRCTVDGAISKRQAMRAGPSLCSARSRRICSSRAGGVWFGDRRGRLVRSNHQRPSGSTRKRRHHFDTVAVEVPN
jgi:hypothetical protein